MTHKARDFVVQAYQELRKVVWPTRRDTVRHTFAIVVMVLITIAFLGALDYGLTSLLRVAILNQ